MYDWKAAVVIRGYRDIADAGTYRSIFGVSFVRKRSVDS